MDNELKDKLRMTIGKINQAVNGMMDPECDDEEKNGWIQIYNGAMKRILNVYLADEPAPEQGEVVLDEEETRINGPGPEPGECVPDNTE